MITPFAPLNRARIRAERRARLRRLALDLATLAFLTLIAIAMAHAILTAATSWPQVVHQARALRGT